MTASEPPAKWGANMMTWCAEGEEEARERKICYYFIAAVPLLDDCLSRLAS